MLLIAPAGLNSSLHRDQLQGHSRTCAPIDQPDQLVVHINRDVFATLLPLWGFRCASFGTGFVPRQPRATAPPRPPVSLQRSSPPSSLRHVPCFKTHSCCTQSSCRTTTAPQRSQASAASSSPSLVFAQGCNIVYGFRKRWLSSCASATLGTHLQYFLTLSCRLPNLL